MKKLQSQVYRIILTLWFIVSFSCTSVFAAQATLSWNPNSESDLAGYKVYYGNSSREYSIEKDVGNQTSYTVKNLVEGELYFFAATAYDFSGNESGYSNEVSYDVPITSDDIAPIIVMLGDSVVAVERGTPYIDAGATATDNIEGDITDWIVVVNDVNTEVEGTYSVSYRATDLFDNYVVVTREVIVIDTIPPVDMTGFDRIPD